MYMSLYTKPIHPPPSPAECIVIFWRNLKWKIKIFYYKHKIPWLYSVENLCVWEIKFPVKKKFFVWQRCSSKVSHYGYSTKWHASQKKKYYSGFVCEWRAVGIICIPTDWWLAPWCPRKLCLISFNANFRSAIRSAVR